MVMHIHGQMVKYRIEEKFYNKNLFLDRLWRKTRSKTSKAGCFGADPNRNWDYQWCEGKFVSMSYLLNIFIIFL